MYTGTAVVREACFVYAGISLGRFTLASFSQAKRGLVCVKNMKRNHPQQDYFGPFARVPFHNISC